MADVPGAIDACCCRFQAKLSDREMYDVEPCSPSWRPRMSRPPVAFRARSTDASIVSLPVTRNSDF